MKPESTPSPLETESVISVPATERASLATSNAINLGRALKLYPSPDLVAHMLGMTVAEVQQFQQAATAEELS